MITHRIGLHSVLLPLLNFNTCLSCVYTCNDQSSLSQQSNVTFHIFTCRKLQCYKVLHNYLTVINQNPGFYPFSHLTHCLKFNRVVLKIHGQLIENVLNFKKREIARAFIAQNDMFTQLQTRIQDFEMGGEFL